MAPPLKRGRENWKVLDRANGTSRRARGGRVRMLREVGIIPATPYKVIARCGLAWDKARPWAKRAVLADSWREGEITARVGRLRCQAFLSVLHTSDDLTLLTSRSQYLKDETFQVPRFRHGGKDGMVHGLSTLFKQTDLPLRISCSKADARP